MPTPAVSPPRTHVPFISGDYMKYLTIAVRLRIMAVLPLAILLGISVMAWFGLKAPPVTRAYSIQRALGLDPLSSPASLGSARYLTGERRAALIDQRDRA